MGIYTILLISLLIVIAVVALALVALASIAANKLLRPPRVKTGWDPKDLGYDFEEVTIETRDKVKLHGWIIPRGGEKTVLVLHGYTASKFNPDYIKPVVEMLARNGFNVVVFDFRAHGMSGGEYTTLGVEEVKDVREIIDWLESNKPELSERIGVIGYSMGGAIALMLGAVEERVKAIVADSPYISVVSSGRRWIMRMKEPLKSLLLTVYPLIVRFAEKRAGIKTSDLDMLNYASKIKKPLLIIAGRRDDLVSLDEIKKLYAIVRQYNENVELWIVDSRHVSAIRDYPKEYEEKVIGFFNRHL